VKNDSKKMKFW